MFNWYDNLILRGHKDIKTKGLLFSKLFSNFKNYTKTRLAQKDLAANAGLTEGRLKAFMEGQFEDIPQDILDKLIAQIQMPREAYNAFAKKTAIPGMGILDSKFLTGIGPAPKKDPSVQQPTAAPVSTPVSTPVSNPVSSVTNKVNSSGMAPIKVRNYIEEPMVLVFDEKSRTISIYPSCDYAVVKKQGAGKIVTVHNCVMFADKLVPGEGELK